MVTAENTQIVPMEVRTWEFKSRHDTSSRTK